MIHTSLVKVIQSLGKRERTDLLRWVESPAINRRPEVCRLCRHLCQTIPMSESPEVPLDALSKTAVFARVFGGENTSARRVSKKNKPGAIGQKLSSAEDATLRYAISFLFTAVKQWLAYREWSQDDVATGLMLCRSLRKRELVGVFEKEFKTLQDAATQVLKRPDFSLAQYQIQFERLEFNLRGGQGDPAQLQKASSAFGAFVANVALRHGCAVFNAQEHLFETVDYLSETLTKVEAGHYQDVPSIQVYYRSFRLMQHQNEFDYQQLKLLLLKYSGFFPVDEIRDAWMLAINYCIRRINSGETSWNWETFELYKRGLDGNHVLENGRMPKSMYQNIMLLAIGCNEWDWARKYLDDYRTTLPVSDRSNAYKFNIALWHFKRKDYSEAQEILQKVAFRDLYYNLDARRMMVRIYYDQGAFSALDSLLHSFNSYLLRHRGQTGYHYNLYINFVRTVRQIRLLKPGDPAARAKLLQKISDEKYLAEREWLLSLLR